MKRIIAILLTVILTISILPLNVMAVENEFSTYIEDTYVFDCMRGEDGKFHEITIMIVEPYGRNEASAFLNSVNYNASFAELTLSDTQDVEPWKVGGKYPVTYNGGNTFYVEVLENPVSEIELDDCIGYYDEESGRYEYYPYTTIRYIYGGEESSYRYSGLWLYPSNFDYESEYDFGYTVPFEYFDTQAQEAWEEGRAYQVTATVCGVSDTFTVTAYKPKKVKSIEIESVELTEGYGYHHSHTDENGITWEYIYYDVSPDVVTVTFEDDTTASGTPDEIYELTGIELNTVTDQSHLNPWGAGEYTATAYLGEVSAEYTIIINEFPIERIVIEDIVHIEGTGYMDGHYDDEGNYFENSYMRYDISPQNITAFFKDGTHKSGYVYEIEEMMGLTLSYDSDQSYENQWGVGEHTVFAELGPVKTEYKVKITESPVEKIELGDISIVENTNGHYDGGIYYYNIYAWETDAKIVLKDGSVINEYGVEIDGSWYSIDIDTSSQYNQPWTAGNTYEATASFFGVTATLNVTIVESPLESIEVEKNLYLYEGIDSNSDGYYYCDPKLLKVRFKDGTYADIEYDSYFMYNDENYFLSDDSWDMQCEQKWSAGNTYQATAFVLGRSETFNVTILENPVQKLEIVKMPDKTEYLQSESFNFKGLNIKIKYKDGTHENIVVEDDYTNAYYRSFYSEKLDRTEWLWFGNEFTSVGEQTVTLTVFGHTCDIPVTVKENPIESITLKENADKTITLTAFNADNTHYDMKVLDFVHTERWHMDEEDGYYGFLLTDKGQFYVKIFEKGSAAAVGLYKYGEDVYNGEVIKSNFITSCDWLKVKKSVDTYRQFLMYEYVDVEYAPYKFDGKVTADNIDGIIQMAGITADLDNEDANWTDEGPRANVAGSLIKELVKKYFALDTIDLTLSEYYDAKSDIYRYYVPQAAGGEFAYCPDKISYNNGIWSVAMTFDLGKEESIKLNDEVRVISINSELPEKEEPTVPEKEPTIIDSSKKFKDVSAKSWYKQYIDFAVTYGIFGGKSANTFEPEANITRAEFVQVLANLSKVDTANKKVTTKFKDVKSGDWFAPAVKWASDNKIVSGKSATSFDPNAKITREEMCVMLVNYASFKGITLKAKESKQVFADDSKISSWAKERVYMCQTADIVNGKGANKFDPSGNALRAEAATIFTLFYKEYIG